MISDATIKNVANEGDSNLVVSLSAEDKSRNHHDYTRIRIGSVEEHNSLQKSKMSTQGTEETKESDFNLSEGSVSYNISRGCKCKVPGVYNINMMNKSDENVIVSQALHLEQDAYNISRGYACKVPDVYNRNVMKCNIPTSDDRNTIDERDSNESMPQQFNISSKENADYGNDVDERDSDESVSKSYKRPPREEYKLEREPCIISKIDDRSVIDAGSNDYVSLGLNWEERIEFSVIKGSREEGIIVSLRD